MKSLKIDNSAYKVGVQEIEGLEAVMKGVMVPMQEAIKARVYWNDCDIESTEYKSRDGFMAYSENCGGVAIELVIPHVEQYEFDFLEFGECDHSDCGYDEAVGECMVECDGHLDAKLRVWLKFEGIKEGRMRFYLYAGGGNGDAPHFRTKHETTLHEEEFSARTLDEVARIATKRLDKLVMKLFKGKAA